VVAAGLAMLIAQGTTQLVAGDTTVANSSPPVTVEVKTSVAPSELSALMSTTALVASHADNCDSSFTHTYIHTYFTSASQSKRKISAYKNNIKNSGGAMAKRRAVPLTCIMVLNLLNTNIQLVM